MRRLNRRSALKWLHWGTGFAILYFFAFEPAEDRSDPGGALSTHAGGGLILAFFVLLWTAMYLSKGLAARAGPKLPGWAKRVHHWVHKALHVGVPVMVLSGALTGLMAPFAISAFGIVPINTPGGSRTLHGLAQDLHEIIFNALIVLILVHSAFHLWRHFLRKDNALRIMLPTALHKYL